MCYLNFENICSLWLIPIPYKKKSNRVIFYFISPRTIFLFILFFLCRFWANFTTLVPGGPNIFGFFTHKIRTSIMFVKKSVKIHSVACCVFLKFFVYQFFRFCSDVKQTKLTWARIATGKPAIKFNIRSYILYINR